MEQQPQRFAYESMGTHWAMSVWDTMRANAWEALETTIKQQSKIFDETYSRFIRSSLIWKLTEMRGSVEVPKDLVTMLRLYETLYDLSDGKCNPLVGFALSDMGYDADYTLRPKEHIRPVPDLHEALTIVDDTHIKLHASVLIDLGALGKGFFVDTIAKYLQEKGVQRFLIDGSGDIFYSGNGVPIRVGLEHPNDTTKVIGVMEMKHGAMCSSAGNRRKWATYHHTIDPHSLTSPIEIAATWVTAEKAAVADGLATCLFLCDPESLKPIGPFDYCIMRNDARVRRSDHFEATLY